LGDAGELQGTGQDAIERLGELVAIVGELERVPAGRGHDGGAVGARQGGNVTLRGEAGAREIAEDQVEGGEAVGYEAMGGVGGERRGVVGHLGSGRGRRGRSVRRRRLGQGGGEYPHFGRQKAGRERAEFRHFSVSVIIGHTWGRSQRGDGAGAP